MEINHIGKWVENGIFYLINRKHFYRVYCFTEAVVTLAIALAGTPAEDNYFPSFYEFF